MESNQLLGTIFSVFALFLFTQNASAQVEKAYVSNFGSGTVSVIDTTTNTVVQTIPIGTNALDIIVDSSCRFAYVADFGGDSIAVIDLNTNTVASKSPPGIANPGTLAISPDNSTLYVDGAGSTVVVLDSSTLSVIATIPTNGSVQTIILNQDGSKLFAATEVDYSVIDTATNTTIETVPTPEPFDTQVFSISPDGQTIYLTDRLPGDASNSAGLIISATTNQIIGTMPVTPGMPAVSAHTLGFPNGNKAYLTGGNSTGNDLMQIYAPATNTFTGNIVIGTRGTDMAFTQDSSTAYVVRGGFLSDDVSAVAVVDTATDILVDTIELAAIDDPLGIAICAPQPSSVPTISEWGAIIMVGVFALAAVVFLRRRSLA